MHLQKFKGNPAGIGRDYGKTFTEKIRKNVDILVKRNCTPPDPLPLSDPDFQKWVDAQKNIVINNWPWLMEEIRGVANSTNLDFNDILLLNLRVWQYGFHGKSGTACSSLVMKLADKTIANVGALDDDRDLYCGMIKIVPDEGFRFVSFPIAGTSWGNRGVNSAGLCVGSSSQVLPGLSRLPGTICADIANRVILQTCATVDDVKKFCKKHPFTLNLACSDKNGDVFAAHCTSAGLFETANKAPCAITNHIVDDQIKLKLYQQGVIKFPESSTTRLRRGRLLDYAENSKGKFNLEHLRKYIADRMEGASCSICPQHNVVLTCANPQVEPGVMWITAPQVTDNEEWVKYECFRK